MQRPTWGLLARVVLAGAMLQGGTRRPQRHQPPDQPPGFPPLGRAQRINGPFRAIWVLLGDKGGLAPHGQPHVARQQSRIDLLPGGDNGLPLGALIRPGHARGLDHPGDLHLEAELGLRWLHQA